MDGYVTTPAGEKIVMRGSLDTRNWEHGQIKLNAMIAPHLEGKDVPKDMTVEEGVELFLKVKKTTLPPRMDNGAESNSVVAFRERAGKNADEEQEQVRKYRDVLYPFKTFCAENGIVLLKQLTVDHLDAFRETWKGRPIFKDGKIVGHEPKTQAGKQRNQQNLSIFLNYAVNHAWMDRNPVKAQSKITVPEPVITPFTAEEWQAIFGAIEPTFPKIHFMVRAFVLVLRESALRISDVVKLRPEDITPEGVIEGVIEINTQKTNEYVWVTLPSEVLDSLKSFEHKSAKYFFWTGNGSLETAKKDWSATMLTLFRAAKIEGGPERRSHNFRKTLGVKVAEKGGLEATMNLLGHRSMRTTQKFYSKYTPGRKDKVRDALLDVRADEKASLIAGKLLNHTI
jgi:integrase/recombinase XerD